MHDKNIQKRFLNDPSPIDIPSPDEAWTRMQKKLDGEEKKRRVIVWWLYPAALVLLLATAWFFSQADYYTGRNSLSKKVVPVDSLLIKTKADKDRTGREPAPTEPVESGTIVGSNESKPEAISTRSTAMSIGTATKAKAWKEQKRLLKNSSKSTNELIDTPGNSLSALDTANSIGLSETLASKAIMQIDSVKELGAVLAQKEEVQTATEDEQADIADDIFIEAGLQWNLPIPIKGANRYFAGPGGASQPYRILFPGFWLSLVDQKNMFTFQVNPFATATLSNTPYATSSTISGADVVLESRTLNKIFGTSASLGYDYNIKEMLWVGGYTQGRFWRSATATLKEKKMSSSNGGTSAEYVSSYTFKDGDWTGFTKFQLAAGVQLLYKLPKWQAGVSIDYTPAPLIDKQGQKNQSTVQFFLRRHLYKQRK